MNHDDTPRLTRRQFAARAGGAIASLALARSAYAVPPAAPFETFFAQDSTGRLKSRPNARTTTKVSGEHRLGIADTSDGLRDGVLHLPATPPTGPMPLLVLFHGAGGAAETQLHRFTTIPDELGLAVLATDSRMSSWDAIRGDFGPDVAFLDRALAYTFARVNVDPARIAIGGFSDGATYALALGRVNGDVFRQVLAFSPGFLIPCKPTGKPKFFVSHGTLDRILPIDECSRKLVPELRAQGYDVTYREFQGEHAVPVDVAREGLGLAAK